MEEALRRHEPPHRHLTDRERSRLVGTDDLCAAQRLDGRQPSHEGVASCHALHAEREGDRDHGGQTLGHRRHGQTHGAEEELERGAAAQVPERRDQCDDAKASPKELAAHDVEPLLKRCLLLRHALEQVGDLAHLRLHSGRDHERASRAGGDARPEKDLIAAIGEGGHRGEHRDVLADGLRFAGEGRLVHAELGAGDESGVCRHEIPGLEHEQVAAHDRSRGDQLRAAAAEHPGTRSREAREGDDGSLRARLLEEADTGVQDNDREDRAAVEPLTERNRHDASADQEPDHHAPELACEEPEERDSHCSAKLVRTLACEATSRFLAGEALLRVRR